MRYILIAVMAIAATSAEAAVQHATGTMTGGKFDQRIVVVPDSASGALAGLSGSMTIRIEGGKHFYDLAYETARH